MNPTGWDWIFIAASWLLGAIALVLLAWALFWDRPRGRVRCPRCWYDMSGTWKTDRPSTVCPECGKRIRSPRRLRKIRRRWRWVLGSVLLGACAYALALTPGVLRQGWWSVAPDFVVVLSIDDLEELGVNGPKDGPYWNEVENRLEPGSLGQLRISFLARILLPGQAAGLLRKTKDEDLKRLAADMLVRSAGNPGRFADPHLLPYLVLARARMAYARCDAFVECGVHRRKDWPGYLARFTTAVQRPGTFRFEYLEHSQMRSPRMWLALQAPNTPLAWSRNGSRSGPLKPTGSSASYGPASGALSPAATERLGGHEPLHATSPQVAGEEVLRGRACYRVVGNGRYGPITLWIDRDTFFLMRLEDLDYTTDFHAVMDPAPHWFTTSDDHLKRLEPIIQALVLRRDDDPVFTRPDP